MQTFLPPGFRDTTAGREADRILRNCVHCGFCNATCPTYLLLGDELDGPRGRIYQIKQALEGQPVSRSTQLHLDRCLTCRACETTCPSGVEYGRLLELGRHLTEQRVTRPLGERVLRRLLNIWLPYPRRFSFVYATGKLLRPLLPRRLRRLLPPRLAPGAVPTRDHRRHMLLLEGCVQPALAPGINAATRRVLDRLGIAVTPVANSGCCGAISHHLAAEDQALDFMRRNIDAWWPLLAEGVEGIVVTASGCTAMIKDYGRLLQDDPLYWEKAALIAEKTRDISEVLTHEDLGPLRITAAPRVAFHAPCTLQHGLGLEGVVESLLVRLGFQLTPVADAHLCCGSAGTYSILQGSLSGRLRDNKIAALRAGRPELIATANIGCLVQLESVAGVPVKHWIELLDPATGA